MMLKYRIFTALLLIPVVLGFLFWAPASLLLLVSLLLFLACAAEWAHLIPTDRTWLFGAAVLISMGVVTSFFGVYQIAGDLLWASIFLAVISFPVSQRYWGKSSWVASAGLILIPLCWYACVQIYVQADGSSKFLYLLLLVWAADTGAYFLGKYAGTHKLIPQVSPGKTIEGVFGGAISVLIVAGVGYAYFAPNSGRLWFTQAFFTFCFALIGDLFISMLKRRVHCKDTGTLLPGHGGLLDRLDSLLAAAPFFYVLGQ